MTLYVALLLIIAVVTPILLYQWWTAMLGESDKPLSDGRDQWNTKR